jgi:hypothetical protein
MRNVINKAKRAAKNVSNNLPAIVETVSPAETGALETVIPADLANSTILDNTTGETVAVEAKPDPRAERADRIKADRAAVAALYGKFEANRLSVPVKPTSAFKLAASSAHPVARGVSQRQCAAIAVAFAAAGVKLKPGASAPRVFEIDGRPSAIENGVIRDAISSGLITVAGDIPESEILTLSATAHKAIAGQLGETLLKAAKLA